MHVSNPESITFIENSIPFQLPNKMLEYYPQVLKENQEIWVNAGTDSLEVLYLCINCANKIIVGSPFLSRLKQLTKYWQLQSKYP